MNTAAIQSNTQIFQKPDIFDSLHVVLSELLAKSEAGKTAADSLIEGVFTSFNEAFVLQFAGKLQSNNKNNCASLNILLKQLFLKERYRAFFEIINKKSIISEEIVQLMISKIADVRENVCIRIFKYIIALDDSTYLIQLIEHLDTLDNQGLRKILEQSLKVSSIRLDFSKETRLIQKKIAPWIAKYNNILLSEEYINSLAYLAKDYQYVDLELREKIGSINQKCKEAFLSSLVDYVKTSNEDSDIVRFAQSLFISFKSEGKEVTARNFLSCIAAYKSSKQVGFTTEIITKEKTKDEDESKIVKFEKKDISKKEKNIEKIFDFHPILKKKNLLRKVGELIKFTPSLESLTSSIHSSVINKRGYSYSNIDKETFKGQMLELLTDIFNNRRKNSYNGNVAAYTRDQRSICYIVYEVMKNDLNFTKKESNKILSMICSITATPEKILQQINTTLQNKELENIVEKTINSKYLYCR